MQCDVCNTSFSQKTYLNLHYTTVHEKIKAFKCEICETSFAQNSALKTHIKVKHQDGFEPKKCDKCDVTIPLELASKLYFHEFANDLL